LESITVSFLPTREDYADYQVSAAKAAVKQKDLLFMRICGSVLIFGGLIGAVFLGSRIYTNVINVLLILYGVFLVFYLDILQPYLVKNAAMAYYDTHGEKMISVSMTFSEETVKIITDRYTACLPYSMLWRVHEDPKTILFYTGIGEMRYLPKRTLSPEELKKIHLILNDNKELSDRSKNG